MRPKSVPIGSMLSALNRANDTTYRTAGEKKLGQRPVYFL